MKPKTDHGAYLFQRCEAAEKAISSLIKRILVLDEVLAEKQVELEMHRAELKEARQECGHCGDCSACLG